MKLAERVFLALTELDYEPLNTDGYFCEALGCDPTRRKRQGAYVMTDEFRNRTNNNRRTKNRLPEIVCASHKGATKLDPAHLEFFGIKVK